MAEVHGCNLPESLCYSAHIRTAYQAINNNYYGFSAKPLAAGDCQNIDPGRTSDPSVVERGNSVGTVRRVSESIAVALDGVLVSAAQPTGAEWYEKDRPVRVDAMNCDSEKSARLTAIGVLRPCETCWVTRDFAGAET